MINLKRLWHDWLIAFIPIVSVSLLIYIFILYPNAKIELSSSDEVNMIYSGLNASRFRFGIIMSLLISSSLSFICAVLYDTYRLKYMIPIKAPAKLKSKYIRNQTMLRSALVSTVFELNFVLENNEIKHFNVTPEQFSLVFENNKGVLTYKEHSKSKFLDFEVIETNG